MNFLGKSRERSVWKTATEEKKKNNKINFGPIASSICRDKDWFSFASLFLSTCSTCASPTSCVGQRTAAEAPLPPSFIPSAKAKGGGYQRDLLFF